MNDVVELRHLLHQNAELSMQEINTKRILMDYMQNNTDFMLYDCGRWFYAVKKGKSNESGRNCCFRGIQRSKIPSCVARLQVLQTDTERKWEDRIAACYS